MQREVQKFFRMWAVVALNYIMNRKKSQPWLVQKADGCGFVVDVVEVRMHQHKTRSTIMVFPGIAAFFVFLRSNILSNIVMAARIQ